jgi:hypothetical protein
MERSEKINELSKAVFKFHQEMGKIAKTSNNPFFKSKYADLPSILDAIREPMANAGLIFISIPDGEGLTTILIHSESEQFISANAIMKPIKNDPQSIGSAITYQRRYSIGSILNLNIDVDDDANLASGKVEVKQPQQKPKEQPKETDEQIQKRIDMAIVEMKDCRDLPDLQRVWTKHKDLQPYANFSTFKDAMKSNIEKNFK